jgi:hypothetical protein
MKRVHVGIAISTVAFSVATQSGCGGGSQEPAESPAPATTMEPSSNESAPPPQSTEGEHTMPDGTTMPGHEHGEEPSPPSATEPTPEK